MTSPGRSDCALKSVTIAHNVHKGHGISHRKTHCISNANMKGVNVVNVIFQKYLKKKNLNKKPFKTLKRAVERSWEFTFTTFTSIQKAR